MVFLYGWYPSITLSLIFYCQPFIRRGLTHPVCLRQTSLYEIGIAPCQWSVVGGFFLDTSMRWEWTLIHFILSPYSFFINGYIIMFNLKHGHVWVIPNDNLSSTGRSPLLNHISIVPNENTTDNQIFTLFWHILFDIENPI